MLALPADPSRLGQRLFHDRRGIHEHFNIRTAPGRKIARHGLELALDDAVIVEPLGVD